MDLEIVSLNLMDKDRFILKALKDLRHHDRKTFEHSMEVGRIASFLVENLKHVFSQDEKRILLQAAFLHDYGKIGVEAGILNKEGELTLEERKKIQQHPKIGFEILKDWNMEVAKVVVSHHEYQENGYPRGSMRHERYLSGAGRLQTKKLSRILAMIDAFQAMLTDRPGRDNKMKNIDYVMGELQRKFSFPEDQDTIRLLEAYYQKNKS